ncbi:ADP-ribosylation factor family-domain-containing protein [Catenaria anguillulae PL171]|uniref:ADP-ribosylation factor family-domain-containing protein n=1 Tax=Catenaria anguillulae PL171 TaxID=765915 RepID=A0A1Y2HDB4_9FUNG|nr:ADP-ribosylation factor family-domain-containing protein [Catenaria anguillulae PL171]ORZ32549.1 ADP-ribosylation factor family-domain-containing protein [Catenaria anguillulae PL171]
MRLTKYLFGCCTKPSSGQHSRQPSIFPIQPTVTILFVGLDSSGKTCIVDRLCQSPLRQTKTSWGFEASLAKLPKDQRAKVRLFDVGGHERIRGIWVNYYAEAHAVCFVVDGSSTARLEEARRALQQVKAEPQVAGKPILVCVLPREISIKQLGLTHILPTDCLHMPTKSQASSGPVLRATLTRMELRNQEGGSMRPLPREMAAPVTRLSLIRCQVW